MSGRACTSPDGRWLRFDEGNASCLFLVRIAARQVSDTAETCPSCGHSQPKKLAEANLLLAWKPCGVCGTFNAIDFIFDKDRNCRGCRQPLKNTNHPEFLAHEKLWLFIDARILASWAALASLFVVCVFCRGRAWTDFLFICALTYAFAILGFRELFLWARLKLWPQDGITYSYSGFGQTRWEYSQAHSRGDRNCKFRFEDFVFWWAVGMLVLGVVVAVFGR